MKRLLIALGFAAATTIVAASISPLVLARIKQGGSPWWSLSLLIPLVIAITGIYISADDRHRDAEKLPTPQWKTYAEMSPEEQTLAARHGGTNISFWHNAYALWDQPWPRNLAGQPAVLTGAQRELAAEHAADKRHMDGLGDI